MQGDKSKMLLGPRNFSLAPTFRFDISNDTLPSNEMLSSPLSSPDKNDGLHIISMSIKQPEALSDLKKNSQLDMKQSLNTDSQ